MDEVELKEELVQKNIPVQTVTKLKEKTQQQSYSYLITTSKEANLNNMKKEVKDVQHLKIKWKHYHRERNYTQCYRYQRFGHIQKHCNLSPRCIKCTGNHLTRECQLVKTNTSKSKCVNCNNEHTANFKNCRVLIDYINERQKNRKKVKHQKSNLQLFDI